VKLEHELKQVRLQVARQERRIAELEIRTMRPEGNDKAARMLGRNPPGPVSMDRANPIHRTAVRRKGVGPADESDGPKSGDSDQKSQAQVSRPDQVKRKRRSRKRRRKSKNAQEGRTGSHALTLADNRPEEHGPVNLDRRSLPSDRVGNESGEPVPGAECTTLTSRGSGAIVSSTATALLQFAIVIEMWKTRLIPVLIWIMQHLKN
jgi:hypothetical protein